MAISGSLQAPLIDSTDAVHTLWRRSVRKIAVVTTGFLMIAVAGFVLISPYLASGKVSTANSPKSVPEMLQLYPDFASIEQVNEFFVRLPAHDMEDVVYQHVKPQAERLFYRFLNQLGSTAPHFQTGQRLERRYQLDDKEEFNYRLAIFVNGLREIIRLNNIEATHNLNANRAIFAVNKFADWTSAEFQTLLSDLPPESNARSSPEQNKLSNTSQAGIFSSSHCNSIPSWLKWVCEQAIHPVLTCTKNWAAEYPFLFRPRDQGTCGSCYAFSVTETLRSTAFIKLGVDPGYLSVQHILDCLGRGCKGGLTAETYNFISDSQGIPRKVDYGPYGNVSDCKVGIPKAVSTTGAGILQSESEIADYVCSEGPASISLLITIAWQYYAGGVMSKIACSLASGVIGGHALQVVGVVQEQNAYLIRNSWGDDWGVDPIDFRFLSGSEGQGKALKGGFILMEYGTDTCTSSRWTMSGQQSFPAGVSCVGNCNFTVSDRTPPNGLGPNICTNACRYQSDGICHDGGPNSLFDYCAYGADCNDCGPRAPTQDCSNACSYANDGECDDPLYCYPGTDCTDCQR